MKPKLPLNENTRLKDIMAAYPWLKDEAMQMDERLRVLDSPLVRVLLGRATIRDAGKRSGFPAEAIIAEIEKMVDRHIE